MIQNAFLASGQIKLLCKFEVEKNQRHKDSIWYFFLSSKIIAHEMTPMAMVVCIG